MKYFLNHISPTLAAIARALACEGIGHTHSYAEEIRTIERVLRQLYPAEHPPEDPLWNASMRSRCAAGFRRTVPIMPRSSAPQAMPKQGASSGFKYGRAAGTIEAAVLCCEIPMTIIEPGAWKKHYHLHGKDKEGGRQRALQLFPAAHAFLARKKDHGRGEAALISLYGAQR